MAGNGPTSGGAAAPPGRWSARLGWLTAIAVLAVATVNVAGIWAIAVGRRGVVEDSRRLFRVETEARATALDGLLAATRADLAFLAGSPALQRVEDDLASDDPALAAWRERAVEGALLIFLRGHPEVGRIVLRGADGRALVAAARRGGVPVVWLAAAAVPPELAALEPGPRRLTALFPVAAGPGDTARGARLVAAVDAADLPLAPRGAGETAARCTIASDAGSAARAASPEPLSAEAPLRADGWNGAGRWSLVCTGTGAVRLLEPLTARHRVTLVLNLVVMGLAVVLGSLAIVQMRRRLQVEAAAREGDRVRELERQLFHAERLATAGRLAAGIAHEINNPLEGMSNYLALARDSLRRGDTEAARRQVDGVREGLEAAAAIVRRVLAHADPSAPPREPIELDGVVRHAVDWVRSNGAFGRVAFVHEAGDGPHRVRGNATQLGQVFLNLVLNACEIQPDGGEVKVGVARGNGRVAVTVADRGPGVAATDRVRIFEPFYSTKRSTGLGLSVCWAIVQQHGGTLDVRDRPGGGAVFRVELPALEATDG